MTISERLKALREEYATPLSQAQLGERLNKSQRAISRLETGEAHLQEKDLIAYCEFFKVSANYILGLSYGRECNHPQHKGSVGQKKETGMLYRRIRDLREDHDLTQKQLGEICSCSQRVYSNYERGELDIPTEILIKLANYYDVSVDYLLNRTDKKNDNF